MTMDRRSDVVFQTSYLSLLLVCADISTLVSCMMRPPGTPYCKYTSLDENGELAATAVNMLQTIALRLEGLKRLHILRLDNVSTQPLKPLYRSCLFARARQNDRLYQLSKPIVSFSEPKYSLPTSSRWAHY